MAPLLDAYGRLLRPLVKREGQVDRDGVIPGAGSVRRPAGHILVDGKVVGDTMQCCHCGCHWVYVKGSGRRRAFCTKCNGVTCGKEACDRCVPQEQWIDRREQVVKPQVWR